MPKPAVPLVRRIRTVLIVDDEPGVLDAVRESLRVFDVRAIVTTDPYRALSIIQQHEHVDLLITDLFMPAMGGARLLKEGRRIRPDLRAVLLTGIASAPALSQWERRGEHIIAKPWLDDEFVSIVTKALEEPVKKNHWREPRAVN